MTTPDDDTRRGAPLADPENNPEQAPGRDGESLPDQSGPDPADGDVVEGEDGLQED